MIKANFANRRTSTATNDGASCVEVGQVGSSIGVGDSNDNNHGETILTFGALEWQKFVSTVASGSRRLGIPKA
jgi:hypothetical protein